MSEPLRFQEIEAIEDALLLPYLDLYETAFPPNERIPVSHFLSALRSGQRDKAARVHLLAALDDGGELIGMARYDLAAECGVAYLIYIAVTARQRGAGLGSAFYREILRRVQAEADAVPLLFEVDAPENHEGAERETAERRIRFYRRLGAVRLRGVRYLQSVDFYPEGVPMHLMFHPGGALTPEDAFQKARCIFGQAVSRTGEALALE